MTLGHNSSVIFYDCENKPIGYEEERLSEIKSDSAYPILAFTKILSQLNREQIQGSNIFVSHWFDVFNLEEFPVKYFDVKHFNKIVSDYNLTVIPVNSSFTHHDAHAYSSLAFAENFSADIQGPVHCIVADGFGNNQEVISIYQKTDFDDLTPIKRVYGFEHSLGLLYQYATSFCGMKENQDEYKFLGYEAQIRAFISDEQIEKLSIFAYDYSMKFMNSCLNKNTFKSDYAYNAIDYNKLCETKQQIHEYLETILMVMHVHEIDDSNHCDTRTRAIIGFYVQSCLEQCLLRVIKKYDMKNVFLSGGCFLNVKLNKVILDNVSGKVCVNPLAGDQGAAIGLFRKYTNCKFQFHDLCFGVRDRIELYSATKDSLALENVFIFDDEQKFTDCVSSFLDSNHIVNIMQHEMEFGPRALCNTSTLALPTEENSMYINMVNDRNEVMPMAPVMTENKSKDMLYIDEINRVIGSNEYMIITHDVREHITSARGVMHNNPLKEGFTSRPQIVKKDSNIYKILSAVEKYICLINTSFNTHGRPILYSFESAIKDFRKQKLKDKDDRLILVILNAIRK